MWRLLLITSLALPCGRAFAFGSEGHRLVAEIAEHYLTPVAQKKIRALLRGESRYGLAKCPVKSLADAATWPDCLRGFGATYKNTFPWHFDDIPLCGDPVYEQYCANDQCLSAQTEKFITVLSNKKASIKDRLEALKFVAHFIGDAHQPLHAEDNKDRGGNEIPVSFLNLHGKKLNLHHVWDTELVVQIIGQSADPAGDFALQIDENDVRSWSLGSLKDWLAESHQVAKDVAYASLPAPPACGVVPDQREELGDAYYEAVKDAEALQLKRAGIRLAKVLNEALK